MVQRKESTRKEEWTEHVMTAGATNLWLMDTTAGEDEGNDGMFSVI